MNKIFYHSSFPFPCVSHLHQATGNNELLNDTQTWDGCVEEGRSLHGLQFKSRYQNQEGKKSDPVFQWELSRKTCDCPSSTNGWALSWACQGIALGTSNSYSPLVQGMVSPLPMQRQHMTSDFLKAQGTVSSPVIFSLCSDCMYGFERCLKTTGKLGQNHICTA